MSFRFSSYRSDLPVDPKAPHVMSTSANIGAGTIMTKEAAAMLNIPQNTPDGIHAMFPYDIFSDKHSYHIKFTLPGVPPENVSVEFDYDANELAISGKLKSRWPSKKSSASISSASSRWTDGVSCSFARCIAFPSTVKFIESQTTAVWAFGVLEITLFRDKSHTANNNFKKLAITRTDDNSVRELPAKQVLAIDPPPGAMAPENYSSYAPSKASSRRAESVRSIPISVNSKASRAPSVAASHRSNVTVVPPPNMPVAKYPTSAGAAAAALGVGAAAVTGVAAAVALKPSSASILSSSSSRYPEGSVRSAAHSRLSMGVPGSLPGSIVHEDVVAMRSAQHSAMSVHSSADPADNQSFFSRISSFAFGGGAVAAGAAESVRSAASSVHTVKPDDARSSRSVVPESLRSSSSSKHTKHEASAAVSVRSSQTEGHYEPSVKSSKYEPSTRSSHYEQSVKSSKYDKSIKSSKYEGPVKSSKYEPSTRSSHYEKSVKSSKYEPSTRSSHYEQSVKSAKHEPSIRSSHYEPSTRSSHYEQSVKSSKYEPSTRSSHYEQSLKSSKREPSIHSKYEASVHSSHYEPSTRSSGATVVGVPLDARSLKTASRHEPSVRSGYASSFYAADAIAAASAHGVPIPIAESVRSGKSHYSSRSKK